MKNLDLINSEEELKKRWEAPYVWGRKQNDLWDKQSNFIYEIKNWELLKEKIAMVSSNHNLDKQDFFNYCSNRWYNFQSAMAVENIFAEFDGIEPSLNSRNRLLDFKLSGIDFDHKTSVYPKNFGKDLQFAMKNPEELISWLYQNQSTQQRQQFANRLFLIVYAEDGQHWKLKAEISWLKGIIGAYLNSFKTDQLKKFEFQSGKTTLSDIIWAVK